MNDLQNTLDVFNENLTSYDDAIIKAYRRKNDGIKAAYCILDAKIDNLLRVNDKLVFKFDDEVYLLFSKKSYGVYINYPHSNIHWFDIEGLAFSIRHGNLYDMVHLHKRDKVEIVPYSEFLEELEKFKKKNYNPDDENVTFQYHNGIPYRDYNIMEKYPEYFKDKYIEEFYVKLNSYEDELYEEM